MRTNSDKIFQVVTGVPVIGTAADITAAMLEVGASGAVVIPNDFSEKISRGESVSVELIIDNTNTILGGTVTRAVQSVVATESAEILAVDRIVAGWNTYQAQTARLSLSTRVFYNPTGGYSDFFLTVLILHSVQIALVFGIAPSIVEEKLAGAKINLAAGIKFFRDNVPRKFRGNFGGTCGGGFVHGRDLVKIFDGRRESGFVIRGADWLGGGRFAKFIFEGRGLRLGESRADFARIQR